jgi:hypothetical protein
MESEKDAAQKAADLAWTAKSGCDFPLLGTGIPQDEMTAVDVEYRQNDSQHLCQHVLA